MTHVELQAEAVKLLQFTGWAHLHVRKSIGKGKRWVTTTNIDGWPDLWCWSARQPGRFLAIEVKVPPDDVSPAQAVVLAELAKAGAETYVLWPDGLQALADILTPRGRPAVGSALAQLSDHDHRGRPRP